MTEPALAPRNAFVGVLVVWGVAFAAAIAVGLFVPEDWRVPWLIVAFGGVVLLSFAVQLWYGRTQGFILRVAGGALGALLVMGVVSVGFGLAALVS
ncbi:MULTISPECIES: hypothetical protein [unclassified Microbacterium]|uniref:hypothetical protein n=1 Tax=unclassified Microbacterium TaxID=2609290 RepID=UPI000681425F|nr:hypothetical protein [Microbacterium sp. GCS4]KNY06207.1 hypothetical protein AKH00_10450 [Microbacterium sp. GCS4]